MSRAQTSIFIQLRSGHNALSSYLHRITKVDSPKCPSCKQADESIHHYLFDCPTWRHERWHMGQALRRDAESETCAINDIKGVKAVLKFVGRTDCFKNIEW